MSLFSIRIDGRAYFFKPGDLSRELRLRYNRLVAANGMRPEFITHRIPDSFRDDIVLLERRLKEIATYTTVIDARRFAGRMPGVLQEKLLPQKGKLVPHAGSTVGVAADDVKKRGNRYALQYSIAYGVEEASVPVIPIRRQDSLKGCGKLLDLGASPGTYPSEKTTVTVRRTVEPLPSGFVETMEYCRAGKLLHSETVGAAAAFLWHYRPEVANALRVLSARHPGILPANLSAAFYELVHLEFYLFDRTDIYQDIAASEYAGSPWHGALKEKLPRDLTDAFAKQFGDLTWRAYSRLQNVPLENQGLGPLQIIPGLALAAFRKPGLFEAYQDILSRDDFSGLESVTRALFDPRKMLALKVMTWDLQLEQLEKIEGLTLSPVFPPHIGPEKGARDLALLFFARQMVQFPKVKAETFPDMVFSDPEELDVYLSNLHLVSHLQGVTPEFDGISRALLRTCPAESFGFYQLHPDGEKVCLFAKRN